METLAKKIKIGVSSCLLGEKVRWNGGHKRDSYTKEILGKYFDCVPVCPEMEAGMGVPREPVHLVTDKDTMRLVGKTTGKDWTAKLTRFSKRKSKELFDLSGFVFKEGSPSCGVSRIPIHAKTGKKLKRQGQGFFAKTFIETWPLIPAIDEQTLYDVKNRGNFIVRVFCYYRLRALLDKGFSMKVLVRFHACHKYLLLAHSRKHCQALGQIVTRPGKIKDIKSKYRQLFMEALDCKTTVKKNVAALQSMMGALTKKLREEEKQAVLEKIDAYRKEQVSIIAPTALIRHYAEKYNIACLLDQEYLDLPFGELMLD